MKLNSRDYQISKAKKYFNETPLFFFFNGINSNTWITIEQSLSNLNFNYYKIFNKTTTKILKNSIYTSITPSIKGITFFIKPTKHSKTLTKRVILDNFESLLFVLLAVKFNNKIYSTKQLKNLNSFEYKENKLALYQFGLTNLKFYFNISK